ncbi:39022_t:CDS:2, partial [Gigaspora margarita]
MERLNNYKYSYFQKQRTSNQTQELRYNISKKDKAIAKWLVSLEETDLIQGSDSTHKDIQTHLNMKEVLILAECGIMDYGILELQEALNNNTGKNAASKRKDEQSISKTKNEDIYSSQWVVTRNEAEALQKPILAPKTNSQVDLENSINSTLYCYNTKLVWSKAASIIGTNKYKNIGARKNSLRGSLSDKTNASPSTQRITEVGKQTYFSFSSEKRPRSDSQSSSKE